MSERQEPEGPARDGAQPSVSLTDVLHKHASAKNEAPGAGRWAAVLALVVACAAVFVTALDQTVVVTALQPIMNDLLIPPTELDQAAWIVSGYLLGYVIVMPLMGRVSDM